MAIKIKGNMNFKEYLDARKESGWAFARRTKLSINTIYKLLHGGAVRIDVAKKIVRATKKEVALEDLGYETK